MFNSIQYNKNVATKVFVLNKALDILLAVKTRDLPVRPSEVTISI